MRVSGAVAVAVVLAAATATPASPSDWVETSNRNAQVLLDAMAEVSPETAAFFGVEGVGEEILDLSHPAEGSQMLAGTGRLSGYLCSFRIFRNAWKPAAAGAGPAHANHGSRPAAVLARSFPQPGEPGVRRPRSGS